jgi:hypothetical protein
MGNRKASRSVRGTAAIAAAAAAVAGAGAAHAAETVTYQYDVRGRLIEVSRSGTVNEGVVTAYQFDKADNRLSVSTSGSSGGSPGASAFSVGDASGTEGEDLSFLVTRTGGTGSSASVDFNTGGLSAGGGTDYSGTTPSPGTLTFAANETAKTVLVHTIEDSAAESTETLALIISNPSPGASIARAQATGTIYDDDDTAVSFSIADASATEGGDLSFLVTRTGGTGSSVSVTFNTGGLSAGGGTDYSGTTPSPGTLTFAANETAKTVLVHTIQDSVAEPTETLALIISNPSQGTITRAQAIGTIFDDDDTAVSFSIADTSGTEGGDLTFVVTRSGGAGSSVTVDFNTGGLSAGGGTDYYATTPAPGPLTFNAGETSKTVLVHTIQDSVAEPTETLALIISNPSQGTITRAQAIGTIYDDDDAASSFSIADASAAEGGDLSFTVTRTGGLGSAASVQFGTAGIGAGGGTDWSGTTPSAPGTLAFAAGEATKTVLVHTIEDNVAEPTETMLLILSSPSAGATIADDQATGTIHDDD